MWTDPDGAAHDKLHLHWRLAQPARGANLAKLKALRALAARLVGGDPSNMPIVHPIRWAGSWWRKCDPAKLCAIEAIDADREIDLDPALAILEAALDASQGQGGRRADAPGAPAPGAEAREKRREWEEAFAKLLAGAEYHPTLVPLAASYAAWGAPEPVAYNTLRSLLLNSTPSDPERLRRRDAELEKLEDTVASAYAKFGDGTGAGDAGAGAAASAAPSASLKQEIDLDLFGVDTPPPDLTHDILPADWVDIIWTSAFAAAAPPDYVALAAIVAAAGAIGNARVALAGPGWREVIVLWGALVGPPSAHKSPAMNDVRLALTRIDKKLLEQWRFACDKLEADHEIELAQALKGQKKNVKKPAKPPLRNFSTTT